MTCASCAETLPAGARFCSSCGAPAATVQSAEERKLITVVFCDLVGSTELSDRLDPETLRSVMLRYFVAMRTPIEELGGTTEKFIGDAVMAVFGVPTMQEDDAARAAMAALRMLESLADLNRRLEPELGIRLRVRIGVNTGPAVTTADVSTRQGLVAGETVNVAARLEQNAGPGQILIGPLCRRALGPAARTEQVGPLRLKGKEQPVTAHRLLGLDEAGPELTRRFDLPFVGRAHELDALGRTLDAVAGGAGPRLVTLLGEPGIGKTRLARAWIDAAKRPIALGTGRCRSFGDHGTLTPLTEAVRGLLATAPGRAAAEECAEALSVLDLGLLRDGTPGPSFDASCSALRRILEEVALRRPAVLVLDDCQWAGDLLLQAVDRIIGDPAPAAVLIVCLARFELLDRWHAPGDRAERLTLPSLSAEESGVLAAALAPASVPADADGEVIAHRLVESAGGNPFYLEQLLAAAAEVQEIRGLPHTLQSVLGARLDAVDRIGRVTLDLAAVLGRDIAAHEVEALATGGPEAAPGGPLHAAGEPSRRTLARLGRRRLVEPVPAAAHDDAFRFSSSLMHEAAYQAMTKRTRAERHERAAGVVRGDATVGGHLEAAYRYRTELGLADRRTDALRLRAAALLTRAGSQASARSDLTRADGLLERAVELLATDDPEWATSARRLAEVRVALGRTAEGINLLRTVLGISPDRLETAHVRLALAVARQEPTAAVAATAREILPVFEAAHDRLGLARASIRMAQEHQLNGQHGLAGALLADGLEHAVRCDAEPERALALGAVGVSLWRGPEPAAAGVSICRDLLAAHGGPRPTVRITLSCPLAVLLALREEWQEARARLAEAGAVAARLGFAEAAVVIPVFAATVESLAGRPERALDLLDEAAEAARALGAYALAGNAARDAARILASIGRPDAAADRLAEAGAAADLLSSDAADLDGIRALIAAARGEAREALALGERAVAVAARTDSPVVQAVAVLDQALVLELADRPEAARAAAARAYGLFEAKGHLPGARQAAQLHARLSRDGRPPRNQRVTFTGTE